jgi:RNA polymerase sigma-70 factor (ECF subfamily)
MTRSDTAPPGDLSVDDLAARARQGDQACFQELVARMRGPLTAFIARRLTRPDDADDAAQETFIRAYRHIESYDPARRFSTWLFAIGKNVAANHRAADRRRTELERQSGPESQAVEAVAIAPPPQTRAEADEVWQAARRLLGAEAYRALWLRYAHDLSVVETARELGRSVVSTKVMLFRARKKLLQEGS